MEKPFEHSYRPLRRATQPWLARLCREGIFLVILVVLIFAPLAGGGAESWSTAVIEAAVWVGGLLWVFRLLVVGDVEWFTPNAILPGIAGLTYVWARFGLSQPVAVTEPETLVVTAAALFFLLVYSNISHRSHTNVLSWVWAGLGLVIAVAEMAQILLRGIRLGDLRGGGLVLPQHSGGYLVMMFSITAANAFFSRRSYRQKVTLLAACTVMGVAIMMTLAYEAWVGMLASTVVMGAYLLRRGDYRFRWAAIGASVLIPVVLMAMVAWQGVRGDGWQSEGRASRLPLWNAAVRMCLDHPLFGNGPGMYAWQFPMHRTAEGHPTYASNEYLNVLADYGIVGLAIAAWVIVSFVVAAVRTLMSRAARYSASTLSNRYALAIGGLAGSAAMIVQAVVDFQLRAPGNLFTLMALMAITLTCAVRAVSRSAEENEEATRDAPLILGWPQRVALLTALVMILGVTGWQLRRNLTAKLALREAARAQSKLDWPAAEKFYRRAAAADPQSYRVARAFGDFYSARATWSTEEREHRLREALRYYDQALHLNSYATDELIKSAHVSDLLGDQDGARARHKTAIQSDPDNASYHAQLGLHHLRWQQTNFAAAAFQRAYEIGGRDPLPEIQLNRLKEKGANQ